MSEWKEYKMDEIALIVDCEHKTAPLVDDSLFYSVRTSNISNGKIDYESCNRVSEETYQEWTKREIPSYGDLILAREAPVGEVGIVKPGYHVCLGQRTVLIRVNNPEVHNIYLLYYLVNPVNKNALVEMSGGSVVSHLNMKDIRSHFVKAPHLAEQIAIASVLSSLDDKIDLLQRQNATLEKMAETLFRQWFVEEAIEEWEMGTLDDILTVKGGTTPSTSESKYWNGTIHWTSPRDITNLNGIYLFDTERKITELGLSKISSGLLPKGTLLMSSRAPVGVLAFSEVPVAINQGYIAILDNKGYSKEFIYLWLKTNIEVVHSFSNGSTFMEISKSAFKTLEIQIPPKQLLADFQIVIKPLFEKIKSNQTQIRTLTTLRDTLLPKLMSGEVRVEL